MPLTLCPWCVCVVCLYFIYEFINMTCTNPLLCALISSCAARLPVPSVCVCPSHPSRAVHPRLSQMSVKIDSSDDTKDPVSSEEEGLKSDDDDNDGDDSNWGGRDRQRDRNTDTRSARKYPGGTDGYMLCNIHVYWNSAEGLIRLRLTSWISVGIKWCTKDQNYTYSICRNGL